MRLMVVIGMLALVQPARAERVLTLDDALALAKRNSRDLEQARARLEQSQANVENAWVALLPQIAVQGKYTHNYKEIALDPRTLSASPTLQSEAVGGLAATIAGASSDPGLKAAVGSFSDQLQQQVAIAQKGFDALKPIVINPREQLDFVASATVPLVVPWAYGQVVAARRNHDATRANTAVTEATVLLSTAQAFFAAAGADELVVARRHAVELSRQTTENARARFEAGTVNRVEVMRAELALVRAEQALAEGIDAAAQAYRGLATIIVLREPFRVAPAEVAHVSDASPDELSHGALHLRPEFSSLEKTIAADDAQVASAKWRWAPTLSGFGNVHAFNYNGFSGDNYSWAVGVQLDWALYDGGARDAARHLAEGQMREAESRLAALRDSITDDIYNLRQALGTRRRALETARRSVELSRETLELLRAQHDAGTATQLDLLQGQDEVVAAEVSLAQARFDLALAELNLQRSAGLFPPR